MADGSASASTETAAVAAVAAHNGTDSPPTHEVDLSSDQQQLPSTGDGRSGGAAAELSPQHRAATHATVASRPSSAISLRDPTSFHFSEYLASSFYSYREGALDKAAEDIAKQLVKPDVDGAVLGSWLLLEVDHWDAETEKVVVLTERSLLSVRYDFVPMRPYRFKKVTLKEIDTVQIGDFVYPKTSIVANKRTGGGFRMCWNRGTRPSFTQRWRTSDDAVPWMTLTHHHLLSLPAEAENVRYNCNDCYKHVIDAVQYAQAQAVEDATTAAAATRVTLKVTEAPIEQNVYLGIHCLIYNQSFMGISKERGGFSF